MTLDASQLDASFSYSGSENVVVGNGAPLQISRTGMLSISSDLTLNNVLVVPELTKNLLSVNKLTSEYPVIVVFTDKQFRIQNRLIGTILASRTCDGGLYRLGSSSFALSAFAKNDAPLASFDLWHSRLGHSNNSVISVLRKNGSLATTSILPSPHLCSSCQKAKSTQLPYSNNDKRSSNVLDLIHCDLWGPAPILSDFDLSMIFHSLYGYIQCVLKVSPMISLSNFKNLWRHNSLPRSKCFNPMAGLSSLMQN